MEYFHNAITWGLDVAIKQSNTLIESGHPNKVLYGRFAAYVRTLGWVIEPLRSINLIVTDLKDRWLPHIENEQRYLYDSVKAEAIMTVEEHSKLIQKMLEYELDKDNKACMLPFIL